jgi:hypothetical protein
MKWVLRTLPLWVVVAAVVSHILTFPPLDDLSEWLRASAEGNDAGYWQEVGRLFSGTGYVALVVVRVLVFCASFIGWVFSFSVASDAWASDQ